MKRWIGIALTVACLLGCVTATAQGGLMNDDFTFEFNGQRYELGDSAAAFINAVESAYGQMSVYEADSCMFSGKDKEFACDEIVIATYPIGSNATDVIETIMVLGGAHQTARGIGIGDGMEAVEASYGIDYTLDYDQMIYGMNNTATSPILVFVLDLRTNQVTSYYMMRNTT